MLKPKSLTSIIIQNIWKMIQIELNKYNTYFVGTFSSQCLLAVPSEQMFQKCEAAMKSYATIERNV
jgi:hypothetical protein